jgi:hypothetical protein
MLQRLLSWPMVAFLSAGPGTARLGEYHPELTAAA